MADFPSVDSPDVDFSSADLLESQISQCLGQYERFGIDLGLDRILALLDVLGNPQSCVPMIHVAGSNGKGSVCAYLSSVLAAAGYRVGRYISPHLVTWRERICINGEPIPASDLLAVLTQVTTAIRQHFADGPSPTQFEVITAAAWFYFAAQKVDIAVIEVGLGGRLDATNVCDHPLVSVITSLSMEHWQRLGPTLADIAREKAGILKPGRPAVIGPILPEAKAVVAQKLKDQGCPTTWVDPAQPIASPSLDPAHPAAWPPLGWAESQGVSFPLALPGQFQLSNAALAIAAIQVLRAQGWQIDDAAVVKGMAETRWPGRLQWFDWQGQKILIDGAHNPAAAVVLRNYVDSLPVPPGTLPVIWVMGMLTTKDHKDVFKALLRPGDQLYLVPVPGHSGAPPADLAALARKVCPALKDCQTYDPLEAGLQAALTVQRGTPPVESRQSFLNPLIVFCGSLYLIGDFFAHLPDKGAGVR
jgi:dihydrofolate synthase / folylpolyglutamate synthase